MEFNRFSNKSPSASVSKLIYSEITPKKNTKLCSSATPLKSIKEEEDNKSEKLKLTPVLKNPFDVKAESLYYPSCSPSVFATFAPNKANDGTLRWSIDHLSILYPADIDESSIPETWDESCQDAKVQKAIDTFFSQNSIVPSPWSSSPRKNGKDGAKMRRMTRIGNMFEDCDKESSDVSTQTMLSIPPSIDLRNILGEYFTCNDSDQSNSSRELSQDDGDSLSTSSLRRKLFVTDEDCTSPCKIENKDLSCVKRWQTPSLRFRNSQSTSTPSSDVLSSSPITPPLCSDSCNILSSPPISPIAGTKSNAGLQYESCLEPSESLNKVRFQATEALSEMAMSFTTESQDTCHFPSYQSERQDTGYVTGSISASQNMTSTDNCFPVSRITPVAELMEECELSNSVSCDVDMSVRKENADISSFNCITKTQAGDCNFQTYPWAPTSSSTPAQSFAFEQ